MVAVGAVQALAAVLVDARSLVARSCSADAAAASDAAAA
jgi:hypothetical protein